MEATMAQRLPFLTFVNSDHAAGRPSLSLRVVSQVSKSQGKSRALVSERVPVKGLSNRRRNVALEVSCTYKSAQVESETQQAYFDESLLLKKKSEEIEPYLSGRCVYLVGMMGSGKTTVGKILSEALGYSFFDCDTLIERELGGISVSDIFKLHGEVFFRDKETEVLQKLSFMHHHVISTGGGAVIRPINWKYMNKGVSVYLDVPLDALARRIAAVGTGSRPLLPNDTGDVYTMTLKRLSSLFDARGEAYTNATVRASVENMAAKTGQLDVCDITPTAIAIEALEQILNFLKKESHNAL